MKTGRRHSGSLRQLPSGRYQVRYTGPDGQRRTAPQTFPSRTLARRWLSLTEADMVRGQWRDPSASTETLSVYALRWVVERELSDRTRELYLGLLERQVLPSLGHIDLTLITPPRVRAYRVRVACTARDGRRLHLARGRRYGPERRHAPVDRRGHPGRTHPINVARAWASLRRRKLRPSQWCFYHRR